MDRLEAFLDRYDGDYKAEIGSETWWSGTLRLTLTNTRAGVPSRSIVFYAAGAEHPDVVMRDVLDAAEQWIAETGIEPVGPRGA